MRAALREFRDRFLSLDGTEKIFAAAASAMGLLFAKFDTQFAKLGLELRLPSSLGALPGQAPKLFVMELFLGACGLLFAVHALRKRRVHGPAFRNSLWLILVLALFAGSVRILHDLPNNPMLVLRNSCFVWYLLFPLFAFHAGISTKAFRCAAEAVAAGLVALFFVDVSKCFFLNAFPAVQWYLPIGGVVGFILVVLWRPGWKFFILGMPLLAFAASAAAYSPINRTTVIAQLAAFVLLFLVSRKRGFRLRVFLPKALVLALVSAALVPVWGARIRMHDPHPKWPLSAEALPVQRQLFHGEERAGLEGYRWEMWKDAWREFLSSPLTGIGFEPQVVYRLYEGLGHFKPNDEATLGAPPVSGPHNSYLNALARMGVAGILFLVLHLLMLRTLWWGRQKAAFWLVWAQVFYAFLNVALEGPVRSFLLLLFLGMALGLAEENRTQLREAGPALPQGDPEKARGAFSPSPLLAQGTGSRS